MSTALLTNTIRAPHLACDIGSNAVRILVGKVVGDGIAATKVQKQSFLRLPIRLGEDVFSTGRISDKKIEKLLETCELIHTLAKMFKVASVQVCATSAVRESENVEYVKAALADKGRIGLHVIDGDQEAAMVQLVVQQLKMSNEKEQLFIDVGGGSTELVHFSRDTMQTRRSFRLGTVRSLIGESQNTAFADIEKWLLDEHCYNSEVLVVGTGGTINTMEKIAGSVDKSVLLSQLDAFIEEASSLSNTERQLRWDLREDKADVIVYGCSIYSRIMHLLGADSIVVPKVGIADGLILQAALHGTLCGSLLG